MSDQSRTKSPHLTRLELGRTLQRIREECEMTPEEAASKTSYSRQTLRNIEKGKQSTRPEQITAFCRIYDSPPDLVSYLCGLAVASKTPGFWESHSDGVVKQFRLYIESEYTATALQVVEQDRIPGMLQTPAYTSALVKYAVINPPPDLADSLSAVRDLRFQRLMERRPAPRVQILLGRAALESLDELPDIGHDQLERLLKFTERPSFEIRVLPTLHTAMGAPFTVLTPADISNGGAGQAFAYLDTLDGCRYEEKASVVEDYTEAFRLAYEKSMPLEEWTDGITVEKKQPEQRQRE